MRKLFSIGIAVIGCFLFTNATGQEAPPKPVCTDGWAEVHRSSDPKQNLVHGVMCDCSSTGWFLENYHKNKKCSIQFE